MSQSYYELSCYLSQRGGSGSDDPGCKGACYYSFLYALSVLSIKYFYFLDDARWDYLEKKTTLLTGKQPLQPPNRPFALMDAENFREWSTFWGIKLVF